MIEKKEDRVRKVKDCGMKHKGECWVLDVDRCLFGLWIQRAQSKRLS